MPSRTTTVVLFLLGAATVLCTALGVWQTRRLLDRRTSNAAALAKRTQPPITLPSPDADSLLADRRAVVDGRWDGAHQFVIRGHVFKEIPGVYVVTPLRPDSGDAVLVLRGFVPAMNGLNPDEPIAPDTGRVRVAGLLRPIVALGDSGEPLRRTDGVTYRYLDRDAVAAALPYPARGVMLQQVGPDTGWPRAVAEAPLDDGPHLNYLLQWFSMATIAAATGGVLLFRRPPPPAPPL